MPSLPRDRKRAREGDRIQHCLPLLFELQEDAPRQARRVIAASAVPAGVDADAAADEWAEVPAEPVRPFYSANPRDSAAIRGFSFNNLDPWPVKGRARPALEFCTLRLSLAKTLGLSSFLQKPVDDGPRVRLIPALGWRAFRRPRRLLRRRPVLRTGRFRRGRVSGRPASFGDLPRRRCLSAAAS
jgi:hypothetical protein